MKCEACGFEELEIKRKIGCIELRAKTPCDFKLLVILGDFFSFKIRYHSVNNYYYLVIDENKWLEQMIEKHSPKCGTLKVEVEE